MKGQCGYVDARAVLGYFGFVLENIMLARRNKPWSSIENGVLRRDII